MPGAHIDELMNCWAILDQNGTLPFANHNDLYRSIDAILEKDTWHCLSIQHVDAETLPDGSDDSDSGSVPTWKQAVYEMWLCDPKAPLQGQISNPELKDYIDYSPHQNELAKDEENHGAVFVPIILGSDKTTVSVATGNNEYWAIYISTGNVHNSAHCGHGQAYPKLIENLNLMMNLENFDHVSSNVQTRGHTTIMNKCYYLVLFKDSVQTNQKDLDGDNVDICPHCHEHTKLLLETIHSQTLWKEYGIVDNILFMLYKPFTASFPRADIHELIAPNILHQIIKSTFKDHLVAWVEDYIHITYPNPKAILADIDCW
ncbi:hypothetical protein BDN67DRAFT_985100 [Paxillus ammoniavirescens]|nr:hypothetical protein BDN67DRAFT_985100 [Paxillus ammoniavirescens]